MSPAAGVLLCVIYVCHAVSLTWSGLQWDLQTWRMWFSSGGTEQYDHRTTTEQDVEKH